MCRGDRGFFRENGLIGDGGDDPVLAAYWLAHTYHQHPDAFLSCSPEDLSRHITETTRMLKAIADAQKGTG